MTNMGDFDAKNVKAHVQLIFNGNTLDEQTLNFGTVKVGIPVKKEFVMKAQFNADDWKKYKSASFEGMKLDIDSMTGDNILNSYPTSATFKPTTLANSTVPKYKKGDIIGDEQYPDTAFMVIGYNETLSGNYYTLLSQERVKKTMNQAQPLNIGMWTPSNSPSVSMEINEAEWKYPVLIDTYSI